MFAKIPDCGIKGYRQIRFSHDENIDTSSLEKDGWKICDMKYTEKEVIITFEKRFYVRPDVFC